MGLGGSAKRVLQSAAGKARRDDARTKRRDDQRGNRSKVEWGCACMSERIFTISLDCSQQFVGIWSPSGE